MECMFYVRPTLKGLVLNHFADQMFQFGYLRGSDVVALRRFADYLQTLPCDLVDEIGNLLVQQRDLESSHVALMIHPNLRCLNLDECLSNTKPFDLEMVLKCAGDKMKNLASIFFPTGCELPQSTVHKFSLLAPNLTEIHMYGVVIKNSALYTLATTCKNVKTLDLRNTLVTDQSVYALCHTSSKMRFSLRQLDVRNTMVSDVGIMTVLKQMSELSEINYSGCLFHCLLQLHLADISSGLIHNLPKYKLAELRSEIHPTMSKIMFIAAVRIAVVLCPDVSAIELVCKQVRWISSEGLTLMTQFTTLVDFSLKFIGMNSNLLIDDFCSGLRDLAPQLEHLRLVRAGNLNDFSHRELVTFDFRCLIWLLLYNSNKHPLSRRMFQAILENCPLLQTFIGYHLDIGEELVDLMTNVHKRLQTVMMNHCNISCQNALKLLKSLTSVSKINLYDCVQLEERDVLEKYLLSTQISYCIT